MAVTPTSVVTLEQAKVHLRISPSRTAEDQHLDMLISVAGRAVERNIDRVLFGDSRDESISEEDLFVVGQVMKLLIGGWYWNRESVTADAIKQVPLAVEWLLDPLRKWAI